MRRYDFTSGKLAAKHAGLGFSEAVADQVDPEFAAIELSQRQVDRLLVLHVHYLKWALDTSKLSFARRLAYAWWIMRGGAK